MKTGRLLKFHRPDADIHAYLYQDGAAFKAAIYVRAKHGRGEAAAARQLTAATAEGVEEEARAWIDAHFPPREAGGGAQASPRPSPARTGE